MTTPMLVLAAQAGGGQQGQGSPIHLVVMIVGCFLIIYMIMIRPQKQREKRRRALLDNLKRNDRVVTVGGIHGVVVSCKDDEVLLKVDESSNLKLRLSRSAIARLESEPDEGEEQKQDK